MTSRSRGAGRARGLAARGDRPPHQRGRRTVLSRARGGRGRHGSAARRGRGIGMLDRRLGSDPTDDRGPRARPPTVSAAAAAAANAEGLVLTARAENHLRGRDDLDATIARLQAYREAGAHVVYAPGLTDVSAIARIVNEVGGPVNVLLMPGGPVSTSARRGRCPAAVHRGLAGPDRLRCAVRGGAGTSRRRALLAPDATYLSREVANRRLRRHRLRPSTAAPPVASDRCLRWSDRVVGAGKRGRRPGHPHAHLVGRSVAPGHEVGRDLPQDGELLGQGRVVGAGHLPRARRR